MGEDQAPPKLVKIAGEFLVEPLIAISLFDKGGWWTVLLEEIFPIFSFSTGNSINFQVIKANNLILSHLRCCNGRKLQSS